MKRKNEADSEQSGDAGDLFVDGLSHVVEGGRPQYDPAGAAQHRNGEQPQKEAVEHHRGKLPIVLDGRSVFVVSYLEARSEEE